MKNSLWIKDKENPHGFDQFEESEARKLKEEENENYPVCEIQPEE